MTEPISFAERRRILAEKRAKERGEPLPQQVPEIPAEDVPDVLGDRSDHDAEMDRIIHTIGILDAYRKWIFGGTKTIDNKTLSRRESLMVSCPNPDHPDAHPSAWLNLDKNTWFCGGCQEGGDVYDLAAIKFGFPRPDYKTGKMFHDLREQIAESYGYRIKQELGGGKTLYKSSESEMSGSETPRPRTSGLDTADTLENASAASPQFSGVSADETSPSDTRDKSGSSDKSDSSSQSANSSNVSHMFADDEDEDEVVEYPELDWREVVRPDTFLWDYCSNVSNDDSPEEYHLFHGFLGLAHAVGRNVYLEDENPVYSNMFICLLGGTGFGKTRSKNRIDEVLYDVLPWKDNGLDCSGVKMVTLPGSGEHLIKSFQHIGSDPSLGKGAPTVNNSVNGVVDFDEFSALLSRTIRQGNTLKTVLMSMADCRPRVTAGSLQHGDSIAKEPFCSITASTQPKSIRSLLTRTDAGSGFINRWIFVSGTRKEQQVLGGSRATYKIDLTDAKESLGLIHAWGSIERKVTFTDEGFRELDKFFRNQVYPTMMKDQTDTLKRLDLLFKRIILLLAINERLTVVDENIVKLSERMFKYILGSYAIVSSEVGMSLMIEIEKEIMRHCERHESRTGRGVSPRELQKYMKRKNYQIEQVRRTLDNLVIMGALNEEKSTAKVGRPTTRYKVALP